MLPNLKTLRGETGISQQKLGEAIEISQQSINQYENQNVEPDIGTLSRLADYFHTSIDYIVGRTSERRPVEPTEPFDLNPDEAAVIAQYRALSEKGKACVRTTLDALNNP